MSEVVLLSTKDLNLDTFFPQISCDLIVTLLIKLNGLKKEKNQKISRWVSTILSILSKQKCLKTQNFQKSKIPQSWQVFTLLLSFNLHFQMILSMPTQKQKMEIDYYATLGWKVRILVGHNEAKLFMNSHSIIHNFPIRISNKGLCTKTGPLSYII